MPVHQDGLNITLTGSSSCMDGDAFIRNYRFPPENSSYPAVFKKSLNGFLYLSIVVKFIIKILLTNLF